MRAIEPMLSNEYDADVEHKLQILTKQAYISQIDAARVIGCASSTVSKVFKNLGIEKNEFGYPTAKVIRVLELQPYIDNLIRLRKKKKKVTQTCKEKSRSDEINHYLYFKLNSRILQPRYRTLNHDTYELGIVFDS